MLQVFFPSGAGQEAVTLQIIFDAQPTNRAGMNGLGDCGAVLAPSTVAQLMGEGSERPQCDWTDDSTLVAQVTCLPSYLSCLLPSLTATFYLPASR